MLGQPAPDLPPGAPHASSPDDPASVRTALTRLALAATAAALTVGGLTGSRRGRGLDSLGLGGSSTALGSAKQLFSNPVTPGNFTGLGFDQCHAPEQSKMDAWLAASPYRAVGIYISGASRGCRDQPNLTPTWISTQLTNGWRLLPITLGPQASCNPSVPALRQRPGDQHASSTQPGSYAKAFQQGTAEASTAVAAAQALGIVPGSTLWYDLEGYDVTNTACRESSLWFLSAWTQQLHALGYVSGVYSSAGSGIKSLDDARVLRPGVVHAARPDLDRAVGRPGQHLDDVHPLRRLDARAAG